MKKYSDTELIDWLEKKSKEGCCPGLINDDAGHWTVSFEGTQNISKKYPTDIWTSFWIKKKEWHKTIREAIKKAIREQG